jgi:hypothetical protein
MQYVIENLEDEIFLRESLSYVTLKRGQTRFGDATSIRPYQEKILEPDLNETLGFPPSPTL